MALTGSPACIKYLLFIFNLIFLVTGVVILSVGAVIQAAYHSYADFLDDAFFSAPALLIAVGSIILIIAFFGCCGAVKENHCMVVTFSVLLSIIFIMELSGGIAGYVLKDRTEEVLEQSLGQTIKRYHTQGHEEITLVWDNLQRQFRCCGIHNASDWSVIVNHTDALPMSCCPTQPGQIGNVTCTMDTVSRYQAGCLDELGNFVREYAVTIGSVGLSLAFIQGHHNHEGANAVKPRLASHIGSQNHRQISSIISPFRGI